MKSISNVFSGVSVALGLLLIGYAVLNVPTNDSQLQVIVVQAVYARAGFYVLLAIAAFVFSGVVMLASHLARRAEGVKSISVPAQPEMEPRA